MRTSIIEKILQSYKDEDIRFSEKETIHKERLEHIMEIKLKNIFQKNLKLYEKVREKYPDITFHNFCKDINYVEHIIANQINHTGDPQKTFWRYAVTEELKIAYEIAKDKKDAYTMAYILSILGKNYLLDKEDVIKPPFDQIVPQTFEITSDPSVIGIARVENLEQKKLELAKKYGVKIKKLDFPEEYTDATIVD